MLQFASLAISAVGLIAVIFTARFIIKEGKDERGYRILGNAGITVYATFLLGYSIIFILNIFSPLNGEQYTFALLCLLTAVFTTYSGTILVLRKQY